MLNNTFFVRLLGDLEIEFNGKKISSNGTRSKKVFLVLAYIIYNKDHKITTEELINFLWQNSDSSQDPVNALKTILHRIRVMLKEITGDINQQIILKKSGFYFLNPELNFEIDYITFEKELELSNAFSDEEKISHLIKACNIYKGNFLEEFTDNYFVLPINTYFNEKYKNAVHKALEILENNNKNKIITELFNTAIQIDEYDEVIYYYYMKMLLDAGNNSLVIKIYEAMRDLLYNQFGTMPNEANQSLYRKAQATVNINAITMEKVFSQISEEVDTKGAMLCDYDFFKVVYRSTARLIKRSGAVASIALLKIENTGSLKNLSNLMFEFELLICSNLRCSDIVSKCSNSQLIVLFNQANYENCCKTVARILGTLKLNSRLKKINISYEVSSVKPMN